MHQVVVGQHDLLHGMLIGLLDLLQHHPRRRDQPRAGQGAERAARGDAGAPGHDRRRDLPARRAVSWCSPRRTPSSRRAPIRCRRPRSTASCSSSSSTYPTPKRRGARDSRPHGRTAPAPTIEAVNMKPAHHRRCAGLVDEIYIDDKIKDYIVDLVFATRDPEAATSARPRRPGIQYGASPRATIYLTHRRAGQRVPRRPRLCRCPGRQGRGHGRPAPPRHRDLRGRGRRRRRPTTSSRRCSTTCPFHREPPRRPIGRTKVIGAIVNSPSAQFSRLKTHDLCVSVAS